MAKTAVVFELLVYGKYQAGFGNSRGEIVCNPPVHC